MRRSVEDHQVPSWRVHEFAADFQLLDVWRYPVELPDEVSLRRFTEFLTEMQAELRHGHGPAAQLFRLRALLGRVFGWDRDPGPSEAGAVGSFSPVYETSEESLLEIENKTVHALMHLARVQLEARDGSPRWAPQMGVYVKPRGRLGRAYMALIGPFRHLIVYPAMMRAVARSWPEYARRHRML